jgi:hypothetical protein
MNGLRLPYFDVERSAITPTIGCIIMPDMGPAIQTRDVRDFVRPSWRRYGVQSVERISNFFSQSMEQAYRSFQYPT